MCYFDSNYFSGKVESVRTLGRTMKLQIVHGVVVLWNLDELRSWSIQWGEKKNPEAVEITRKIQELLKPGDGRPGIAYNFIDAQVRFTFRIQQICKQPYFSVDSVHDLSLVYVCLWVSLGDISHESPSSKIFPFLLGPQSCVASVRVISNFLCHTQLCSANVHA